MEKHKILPVSLISNEKVCLYCGKEIVEHFEYQSNNSKGTSGMVAAVTYALFVYAYSLFNKNTFLTVFSAVAALIFVGFGAGYSGSTTRVSKGWRHK